MRWVGAVLITLALLIQTIGLARATELPVEPDSALASRVLVGSGGVT